MRNPPFLRRLTARSVPRPAELAMAASVAVVMLPEAAQAPPLSAGVQFCHPVDLNAVDLATGTCPAGDRGLSPGAEAAGAVDSLAERAVEG